MIQATAAQMINQFATNLKAQIGRDLPGSGQAAPASAQRPVPQRRSSPPSAPAAAKPISGFSLMAKVLWASIMKLFGRRTP